jgi:H+/gluconate symporter-like permease
MIFWYVAGAVAIANLLRPAMPQIAIAIEYILFVGQMAAVSMFLMIMVIWLMQMLDPMFSPNPFTVAHHIIGSLRQD